MAHIDIKEWLNKDNLDRLTGWARDGLTMAEIAGNVGVTSRTLQRWQNLQPEIKEALRKGKEPADVRVENELYRAAIGYKYTVKKPIKIRTEKTLEGKGKIIEERIEFVDEEFYVPGNQTAQIFWLKNRKPEKWRDKQVIETQADGKLSELIAGLKEPVSPDDER